ncbi:MAG: 16S rRNA (cytosine(1402)-N(4))-methyltransferase RsmH [Candidatus Cloacimonetes bacterium]|nr:16S rRNA (cytosine(1402)-N(4))-methyltransferase RsmH [Candidatus Cloacimonadota bacterium]
MKEFHIPVLKKEAIEFLNIKENGIYIDATTGGGGHLCGLFEVEKRINVLAFDQDIEAIKYAKERCKAFEKNIIFVNKNFSYLYSALILNRIDNIDGIIFDLGISNHQIKTKTRGFSYSLNHKLDMRMNKNGNISAYEVVNYYPEQELGRVIHKYGEERYWKSITKKIIEARNINPVITTFDLKHLIEEVVPKNNSVKSLSRVFQAIRIEVNHELDSLKKGLESAIKALNKGGRIVVISYHSLEDRIVKQFFRYESLKCICPPQFPRCICDKEQRLKIITKHPREPSGDEILRNQKARSAKLRVAERC